VASEGDGRFRRTRIPRGRAELEAAGARLAAMLEAGQSQPWQETLYTMTGERRMDAGAILEYFAPLKAWLDRQNTGQPVGW